MRVSPLQSVLSPFSLALSLGEPYTFTEMSNAVPTQPTVAVLVGVTLYEKLLKPVVIFSNVAAPIRVVVPDNGSFSTKGLPAVAQL